MVLMQKPKKRIKKKGPLTVWDNARLNQEMARALIQADKIQGKDPIQAQKLRAFAEQIRIWTRQKQS